MNSLREIAAAALLSLTLLAAPTGAAAEPGALPERSARNIFDGFGTARRPVAVISKTPSSLAAPKRFFTARTTRCA